MSNQRMLGGFIQVSNNNLTNSSQRQNYVGQVETFSLDVGQTDLVISLIRTTDNYLINQNINLVFNFYPVIEEENYINEIYNNDNKARKFRQGYPARPE